MRRFLVGLHQKMISDILIYAALFGYSLFCLMMLFGWQRAVYKSRSVVTQPENLPEASLIIAFRNEEKNIPNLINSICLLLEKSANWQIILVNDHSDDLSVNMLNKAAFPSQRVQLLHLPQEMQGKKMALQWGINHADTGYLHFTDADCTFTPQALNEQVRLLCQADTHLVCAPVIQSSGNNPPAGMADLEFLSLIGSGLSFWGLGLPFMANAAAMGIKKDSFETLGGFKGNEDFPGGDDVFLIEKTRKHFGAESIRFLSSAESSIRTEGDQSFSHFLQRRIRWGAKSRAYSGVGKILTLTVVLLNLIFLVAIVFSILDSNSIAKLLMLTSIKVVSDSLILLPILLRFRKYRLIPYLIPASVLYPFYIVFTAFLALAGNYQWKNRKYKK